MDLQAKNKKTQKRQNDSIFWAMVLLFVVVASGHLILDNEEAAQNKEMASIAPQEVHEPTEKALEYVDLYLKKADQESRLANAKAQIRNKKLEGSIGADEQVYQRRSQGFSKNYGLDFDQNNHNEEVMKRIEEARTDNLDEHYLSPEARVSSMIAQKKYLDGHQQAYEQEYRESFIANAEKNGYQVELNENWDVVSVKKIRTKEPIRFPQSIPPAGKSSK